MAINDYLVIAMFLTFVGLLFTGFPVAWVLGGVSVLFTLIGYLSDLWFGTWTGLGSSQPSPVSSDRASIDLPSGMKVALR